MATVFTLGGVLAVFTGMRRFAPGNTDRLAQNRHVGTTIAGLAVWGIEGAIFVLAASPFLEVQHSLSLYLCFTAIVESSLVPMALGVAELPALLAITWGVAPTALALLLMFHASRLILLMGLGLVYLPRYKLAIDDLLDTGLIIRLAASQRPTPGWQFKDDGAASYDVSVVIPAYNEAQRLPPYLDSIIETLKKTVRRWEVIVVDDGSSDSTCDLVRRVASREPTVRLVRNSSNLGKGGAVARGVSRASGHYILFADADGATPASEIDKLLSALHSGAEIAIGSRRATDVAVTLRRESIRAVLGSFFYTFVNFFAVPGIKDTQCGFKAFRRDAANRVFHQMNESGWAFDVEILYRAQLVGYFVAEVPVNWQEMEGSKLNPVLDAIRMARAIFKIRRQNAGFLRRAPAGTTLPGNLPAQPGRAECVS